ncbi:MAG: hypothetical protein HY042_03860 [Spirochaetia bacterium]|nr:hypothetical protein [Spirochaetia bacterium]
MKNWQGLLPVLLVWIVGGWLVFSNRHAMLARISSIFVTRPEPGRDLPHKAKPYVEHALERTKDAGVRLDLMAKACRYKPFELETDFLPAHWLEKVRDWKVSGPSDAVVSVVEPDAYWKDNRAGVLSSLRDLLDAEQFAFELPAEEGKTMTVIPRLVGTYAAALCRPDIAVLSWGDYAAFQEARAHYELTKDDADFETAHDIVDEQELFVLERLRGNALYLEALAEYAGMSFRQKCRPELFQLGCSSPLEAVRMQNRRLYFAPAEELPPIYLTLGHLHAYAAEKTSDHEEHYKNALNRFAGALKSKNTEQEARFGMIDVYLHLRKSEDALLQLRALAIILKDSGFTDAEFREKAHVVLEAAGRHRDADCFAPMADLPHGGRAHCENLRL